MKPQFFFLVLISLSYEFYLVQSMHIATNDKAALLAFKSSISEDPFQTLASWNESTNHCQWQGVTCSLKHTARVVSLQLDLLNLTGSIPPSLSKLFFLQNLNLAYNGFQGMVPHELGSLSRLVHLNMSFNSLQGMIPHSLSRCSRIRVMDFKSNNLQGAVPSNLSKSLQILRLSNNKFEGSIPIELGSLYNLTYIDLGNNNLEGNVPSSLGNISSLFAIDFSQNNLIGEIPSSFEKLTSLGFIYLSHNSLWGNVPSLFNLSSLMYLHLSYNNLTGRIPNSLGNLSSIISIDFTMNTLSGSIPSTLGNLRNLDTLLLTGNLLEGKIPESLGSLPSLQHIGLSHNQLSGNVPPSIYNISTLTHLGVSDNQLVSTIPNDIGTTLPNLQQLVMYYNYFHGSIAMSLANATGLTDVELTGNSFSGKIPSNLGNLQDLYWLSLDRNQFNGRDIGGWDFLDSLTNCTQLQSLGLDYNGLGGVLPKSIANLSKNIEWLALGGNNLYGQIPEEIQNLVSLNVLGMDSNFLNGSIPTSIGKLSNLQELYLFENKLSGTIPSSIGNISNLNKLSLGYNFLKGNVPPEIGKCQALRWLNISNNQLIGNIPKQVVSISSLTEFLDLSHNSFTGHLPLEVGRLKNLVALYISDNKLSGEIPDIIGQCQLLNTLRIDGNMFQGIIPSSMNNLKGIQDLDLSRNNFSGKIPEFLETFKFLKYLNISFNNFEGKLPTKGIFKNSSAVSVLGNDKLCGGDQRLNLQSCENKIKEKENGSKRIRNIVIATFVPLCSLIVIWLFLFWLFNKRRTKAPSNNSIKDGHSLKVSFSDILKATEEFSRSNLIGMGSFGSVYKGIIKIDDEEDMLVAIKVLNLEQKGASKSFMAECDAMKGIRHRNLVKLFSSCSSLDRKGNEFQALIYEYMSNGSLEEWLHTKDEKLNLNQRLNMAIDVANALDYLHNHHDSTPIVHCDLKPSNVLLDGDMIARVGDFGLAKFLSVNIENSSKSSMGVKGTYGYVAPEYGITGKVSTQGDIYSYGILLLEMFTCIRPTDEKMKEGENLHKLVQTSLPARVKEITDPYLITEEYGAMGQVIEEILISILDIGLLCSKESPKGRKLIKDVIIELVAIRDWLIKNVHEESRSEKEEIRDEGSSQTNQSC